MPPGWHPAAVQPAPAQPAPEQPGSGATAAPLEALSRIGVFQQLATSSLRSLAEGLQQLDVPAGGVVLREGEPGDALYLIAAGTLDVLVGAPPAVTTVARLGPGEFFGEVALLTGQPRTATVRAETAATLWALTADRLRAVMADDAVLSEIIRRTAYERTTDLESGRRVDRFNIADALAAHGELRIGRLPDNDILLNSPVVSGYHAVVRSAGGGLEITDLASSNGTLVNGAPVRRARLKDGDVITIADRRIVLDRHCLSRLHEPAGIRLDLRDVTKVVKGGATLLHGISLSVLGGEFVALVGGSGAGKTTLLDAIAGLRPATGGQVLYNGEDLAVVRDRYRHSLGYVPQDDIIHRELPLRATLEYAARLRLPLDTSRADRAAAVDHALAALQLTRVQDVRVNTLSGGQRKRASIGVELLTAPRVFFLDEPTSGLDPATDRAMMELLRGLSRTGSTVVLTTHATANVGLCDKVVFLARGGWLAFFGTPQRALEYFGVDAFDRIYTRLEQERTPQEWAEAFAASPDAAQRTQLALAPPPSSTQQPVRVRPRRLRKALRQYRVLSARTLRVYRYSPARQVPQAGSPVLFGLLLLALLDRGVFAPDTPDPGAAVQLTFMLAFTTFAFGLLYGVQDIVQELAIFRRERAVDQGVVPYVLAKATLLAPILLLSSCIMLLILGLGGRLPDGASVIGAMLLAMVMANLAGLGLALMTSSAAPTQQAATDLVTILVMPQILFGGALFPVATLGAVGTAISAATATRWAFEGIGRAAGLDRVLASSPAPIAPQLQQQYADSLSRPLWQTLLVLAMFAVVPMVGAALVLRRRTRLTGR